VYWFGKKRLRKYNHGKCEEALGKIQPGTDGQNQSTERDNFQSRFNFRSVKHLYQFLANLQGKLFFVQSCIMLQPY